MFDVFLDGSEGEWRSSFKKNLSGDIKVFDASVDLAESDRVAQQFADQFTFLDRSSVAVFYFNGRVSDRSLIRLGHAMGSEKPCVVCLDNTEEEDDLKAYSDFFGAIVVYNLEDAVVETESYLAQEAEIEA